MWPYMQGVSTPPNELTEHIFDLVKADKVDDEEMPAYSAVTRRLGFGKNILSI